MTDSPFAAALTRALEDSGLTQEAAAERVTDAGLDVSLRTLINYLSGKTQPSWPNQVFILKVLRGEDPKAAGADALFRAGDEEGPAAEEPGAEGAAGGGLLRESTPAFAARGGARRSVTSPGGDRFGVPDEPLLRSFTARRTARPREEAEALGFSARAYPVTAAGHGASETGRDNDSEGPSPVLIPDVMMRRWMGGRLPAAGGWTFAVGTSGEPHIPNGYPIFVEPLDGPLVDGERYAVWLGEAEADVVKRVQLGGSGAVTLYADNKRVPARTLRPTDDPTVWRTEDGGTIRFVVQGRVTFPPDAPAAISGELAAFAKEIVQAIARPEVAAR
jgi:hypothetical protein